jgi:putative endonuclease
MTAMFGARKLPPSRLGQLGERRAAWFYRLRGYEIVDRNLRLRSGEIDLLVRRGKTVAVVEVKTRQTLTAGEGHDAVDGAKRTRLVKLADEYLARHASEEIELRYDILSIFWNGRRFVVTHYPDAFRPVSDPLRPWKWRT